MGDRDHRARVVVQMLLQPRDALRVEVVGGLVEQQHVRLGQQQPGQRNPALLPTAELGHVRIAGRRAQGVHRQLQRVVELPAAAGLDDVLQLALLLEQLVHLVVRGDLAQLHADLLELLERRRHLGHALLDVALDVLALVELGLLGEVPDLDALGRPGLALKLLVRPGHDAQDGALARAVVAEDPDLRPREELQVDPLEDLFTARPDLAEVPHREDVLVRRHGPRRIPNPAAQGLRQPAARACA